MRRPTGPVSPPRRRPTFRPRPALLLACLLAVFLAACSELEAVGTTQQALANAGFASANVTVNRDFSSGQTSVEVTHPFRGTDPDVIRLEQDNIAEVVWMNAPVKLAAVTVSTSTPGPVQFSTGRTYSRAELESRFGPRPAGLDDEAQTGGPPPILLVVGIAVFASLLLAGAILLWVLIARARRQNRAVAARHHGGAWPGGPGGGQGWAPPPAPGQEHRPQQPPPGQPFPE
jgi:hypothetical protein